MADWKMQSLRLWQNIGKRERYVIFGSAIVLFLAILIWSYWWGGRPEMVPLFTNMEAQSAGEVSNKLKEMKVQHEIGENGTAIMVPSKDVYRIRLELAAQGLPRGNKGFEIFDQNKFGTTEFQNKVNLLQALQGELTRTIEQMSEVEKARVHIVLPEDSLYKKNEKAATASIMLKLKPGKKLSREQVNGIVNLAAHSVQGLKPENITVVDNYANVLNNQSDEQVAGAGTMTQLELTKKVQDDLQKNVQSLLEQVLGPEKAAARVNVELNFDQRTVDKQTFEPVVDDKGVIRSSQDVNETFRGTSNAPGGPPGTTSNIPGYVTNNNNNNQSNYEKKESTRNYEINETKEKIVSSPGSIRRMTVAVLVDSNISRAQQDSLMKAVSSAIGLNPARGDAISVESMPFNTELADRMKKEEQAFERDQQLALWLKIGAVVLLIGLIAYAVRLRNRKKQEEQELEMMAVAADEEAVAGEKSQDKEMSPQEKERLSQREFVEKMAKSKPDDVAQLIKAWLTDE